MSVAYGGGQQQLPLPQPPPMVSAYTSHSGRSSVGPVIGVLALVAILGVISAMIGRLCAGRRIPGLGQYDFEGWFERKFAPCIDGRIGVAPPPLVPPHANANGSSSGSVPIAIPMETPPQPQPQPAHMKHPDHSESSTAEL